MAISCQLLVSRAKQLELFLSIGPFPGSTASVKFVGKAEIKLNWLDLLRTDCGWFDIPVGGSKFYWVGRLDMGLTKKASRLAHNPMVSHSWSTFHFFFWGGKYAAGLSLWQLCQAAASLLTLLVEEKHLTPAGCGAHVEGVLGRALCDEESRVLVLPSPRSLGANMANSCCARWQRDDELRCSLGVYAVVLCTLNSKQIALACVVLQIRSLFVPFLSWWTGGGGMLRASAGRYFHHLFSVSTQYMYIIRGPWQMEVSWNWGYWLFHYKPSILG